ALVALLSLVALVPLGAVVQRAALEVSRREGAIADVATPDVSDVGTGDRVRPDVPAGERVVPDLRSGDQRDGLRRAAGGREQCDRGNGHSYVGQGDALHERLLQIV